MPVNWGRLAGQLGSLGFSNLAREAVSYGAEAEERRRADIRLQAERERLLAEARRSSQSPAPKVSVSELKDKSQAIEALWGLLVPTLRERVRRGEVSSERALVLQEIMSDFDRARALPDLANRVVEMNKVMARAKAIVASEQK